MMFLPIYAYPHKMGKSVTGDMFTEAVKIQFNGHVHIWRLHEWVSNEMYTTIQKSEVIMIKTTLE